MDILKQFEGKINGTLETSVLKGTLMLTDPIFRKIS